MDGLPTTAGSALPPEELAGPEAAAVSLLKRAGAVVLGKTVTTEFAYFEPGPTRNPRDPSRTPGGSSSGSAAAVAAGYCPVALGTQTIGSIIRPAAYCGVVGYKPTYGRISTQGIVPLAESFDTVGLLAGDVAWVARTAAVLCASWREIGEAPKRPPLTVPDGPLLDRVEPVAREAFEWQIQRVRHAGYEIRRTKAFAKLDEIERAHKRLMFAEMARVHADWFARYEALYRPRTAAAIREGMDVPLDEQHALRASRLWLRSALAGRVWACPAATGAPPAGLESTGDPIMNLPWTNAGLPAVTIPMEGFGLQIVGEWMRDEELLTLAATLAA